MLLCLEALWTQRVCVSRPWNFRIRIISLTQPKTVVERVGLVFLFKNKTRVRARSMVLLADSSVVTSQLCVFLLLKVCIEHRGTFLDQHKFLVAERFQSGWRLPTWRKRVTRFPQGHSTDVVLSSLCPPRRDAGVGIGMLRGIPLLPAN